LNLKSNFSLETCACPLRLLFFNFRKRSCSHSIYKKMTTESHGSPDVATPEELKQFVESAGDSLLVIDVRSATAAEDAASLARTPLPDITVGNGNDRQYRPRAVNLPWDRATNSMPLPSDSSTDTPIITHCGGGKRGQLAKDYLLQKGYTNVLNGGGPKQAACWNEFGDK
jgi:rhodanese-related sulfurtransferase